jgi:hypothetical protein
MSFYTYYDSSARLATQNDNFFACKVTFFILYTKKLPKRFLLGILSGRLLKRERIGIKGLLLQFFDA